MIERALLAGGFLAVVLVAGCVVRALAVRRTRRLATSIVVEPAADGTARLLVFSSRWCSDCATQHEMIEQVRASWPRPVAVSYHDAATEGELARRFGIVLVPALVVADPAGRVVDVKQGLVDADRLRSLIAAAA